MDILNNITAPEILGDLGKHISDHLHYGIYTIHLPVNMMRGSTFHEKCAGVVRYLFPVLEEMKLAYSNVSVTFCQYPIESKMAYGLLVRSMENVPLFALLVGGGGVFDRSADFNVVPLAYRHKEKEHEHASLYRKLAEAIETKMIYRRHATVAISDESGDQCLFYPLGSTPTGSLVVVLPETVSFEHDIAQSFGLGRSIFG